MQGSHRYNTWNTILIHHCLLADGIKTAVCLTITPQILSAALREQADEHLPPEACKADFAAAVAAQYKEKIIDGGKALTALADRDLQGRPLSVAFLGLSVLAAYSMQTDKDLSGRAYYPRLSALLACDPGTAHPPGFDPGGFAWLWDDLASWLDIKHDRKLAEPADAKQHKYLAFPLAHVPLRQVDVERLPHFFDTHFYEPRTRAPIERLTSDLYARRGPWPTFTDAGKSALADPGRRLSPLTLFEGGAGRG
jgi:hypothetical protein